MSRNNSTSNSSFDGVDIGKSSGPSSSRLKQANHSGLKPKETGTIANTKGNSTALGKPGGPVGTAPVTGSRVMPKNGKC